MICEPRKVIKCDVGCDRFSNILIMGRLCLKVGHTHTAHDTMARK